MISSWQYNLCIKALYEPQVNEKVHKGFVLLLKITKRSLEMKHTGSLKTNCQSWKLTLTMSPELFFNKLVACPFVTTQLRV